MLSEAMFRRLISTLTLASSLQNLRAGELNAARRKLNHVLATCEAHFDFIQAYDAIVMVQEDRHSEARERFRECLRGLPDQKNADEKYISNFCRFYLASYEDRGSLAKLRDKAAKIHARRTVTKFLRFPTEASINELIASQSSTQDRRELDWG